MNTCDCEIAEDLPSTVDRMKSFVAFALIACLAVAPIRAQEEPEVEADEPLDLNAHLLVHKVR